MSAVISLHDRGDAPICADVAEYRCPREMHDWDTVRIHYGGAELIVHGDPGLLDRLVAALQAARDELAQRQTAALQAEQEIPFR